MGNEEDREGLCEAVGWDAHGVSDAKYRTSGGGAAYLQIGCGQMG
jgi:hypothetical protein